MIRFFDIVFSLTSLIALSPLLLVNLCSSEIYGEGEVFYLQKRVGLGLSFIKIYKFATMKKNSEFNWYRIIDSKKMTQEFCH